MNRISYRIERKTSKYNKYMKWHLETYREGGSLLSSDYFKTRKLAENTINRSIETGKKGFPIGNSLSFSEYHNIS